MTILLCFCFSGEWPIRRDENYTPILHVQANCPLNLGHQ